VAGAVGAGAEAGYVGFTTSAIVLVCSAFGPLTPVLLPRLSRHLAGPTVGLSMWRRLGSLPLVTSGLAAIGATVLIVWAPMVVRGYLGPDFSGAVPILRLGVLAAIPLAAFYAARPTLDAIQDKPATVRILVGGLLVEVIVTLVAGQFVPPAYAAVLGLGVGAGVLGVMSAVALRIAVRGTPVQVP
jgi:O-antigen/teichoic acid export membrane protein